MGKRGRRRERSGEGAGLSGARDLLGNAFEGGADGAGSLVALAQLAAALKAQERVVVAAARAAGTTWSEIGGRVGITAQGAHQRWSGHG